jgi:hypothetical protein
VTIPIRLQLAILLVYRARAPSLIVVSRTVRRVIGCGTPALRIRFGRTSIQPLGSGPVGGLSSVLGLGIGRALRLFSGHDLKGEVVTGKRFAGQRMESPPRAATPICPVSRGNAYAMDSRQDGSVAGLFVRTAPGVPVVIPSLAPQRRLDSLAGIRPSSTR